jgi:hypothetical protein
MGVRIRRSALSHVRRRHAHVDSIVDRRESYDRNGAVVTSQTCIGSSNDAFGRSFLGLGAKDLDGVVQI